MMFSCTVVTTVAGGSSQGFVDATGSQAIFTEPIGVAVDASGNVYVAAFSNQRVRKINPAGGAHAFARVCSCRDVSNGREHVCICVIITDF
jgi:DNA-binding beta-propeller fold protein YncE